MSEQTAEPSTAARWDRSWWRAGTAGLAAAVSAGLVVMVVSRRKGEAAHAGLDRFEQEVIAGRFTSAVSHFRLAESACEGSAWPVPGSATSRLVRARAAPDFLERLLPSTDLDGSEAALHAALDTSLGQDPGYEFALGVTLRRRGKLAEAGQRFESVVTRLADRNDGGDPPVGRGEAPDPSSAPALTYTSAVVGDAVASNSELRLAYAVMLLESRDFGSAKAVLLRPAEGTRDRPFGSRFHLWLAERLDALGPNVPPPAAGGPPHPAAPVDLRDHALLHLYRGHYTTAAELFRRALDHPGYAMTPPPAGSSVDPVRYFAAAAAVRSGRSGRFGDKDSPTADDARRWHAQALAWAAADLRQWSEIFARPAGGIELTADWYRYLRYDYFLAVTRDHPLNAALTEEERAAWGRHWGELDRRFGGLRPDRPSRSSQ